MYLIDTSILIDFFRERDNSSVQKFLGILYQEIPFGISGQIYQEILQGAATQKDFDFLVEYFETQRFFHLKHPVLSYQEAAWLFFACRKKGLTIRSTADCLIAQIAIENNLILLHNDKDFQFIQKIAPTLKLAS